MEVLKWSEYRASLYIKFPQIRLNIWCKCFDSLLSSSRALFRHTRSWSDEINNLHRTSQLSTLNAMDRYRGARLMCLPFPVVLSKRYVYAKFLGVKTIVFQSTSHEQTSRTWNKAWTSCKTRRTVISGYDGQYFTSRFTRFQHSRHHVSGLVIAGLNFEAVETGTNGTDQKIIPRSHCGDN